MAVVEGALVEVALAVGVLLAFQGPGASPLVWLEEVEALALVEDLVAEEVALEVAVSVAAALVEAALEVVVALEVLGVLVALGLEDTLVEASTKSLSTRASCSLSV